MNEAAEREEAGAEREEGWNEIKMSNSPYEATPRPDPTQSNVQRHVQFRSRLVC